MPTSPESNERLRIMLLGAHPDDCESKAGGYAALMAARGHIVQITSMTDGSLGHHKHPAAVIAQIRQAEAASAAGFIGARSVVLPNADGELTTDLTVRKMLVREIRRFSPDLIITHRPNDYHVDHRHTAILMQDAAYMLRVPGFCPDTPIMDKVPHIMYFQDRFTNPVFSPDVVIAVDSVIDTKFRMMASHQSQYFEWLPWIDGLLEQVPAGTEERLNWLRSPLMGDSDRQTLSVKQTRGEKGMYEITQGYQDQLRSRYGDAVNAIRFCEAFAASEYSAPFTEDVLQRFFPD